MKADVLTTVAGRGRCKWWARVSRRSKTPQSDKLRGRGDQLSLPSPPGFVLNLPHFHSVSVSRWTSRGKRGEGSRHLGVRRLSLSFSTSLSVLALSRSNLSSSWLLFLSILPSLALFTFPLSLHLISSSFLSYSSQFPHPVCCVPSFSSCLFHSSFSLSLLFPSSFSTLSNFWLIFLLFFLSLSFTLCFLTRLLLFLFLPALSSLFLFIFFIIFLLSLSLFFFVFFFSFQHSCTPLVYFEF